PAPQPLLEKQPPKIKGLILATFVSVPISTSDGFLHRLRQPLVRTMDNLQAMPPSGAKPQ
ncbi:MAG TPA: hypothetical protein PLW35_13970, partial [Verrucomicrobiota bacterium]|nr:hypothetical protein [Verrucomicrobiota bacterium]